LQSAAEQQGFDPPFIALVAFPQILDTMAQNIDDYAAIGAAFSANQAEVMDSIQRLRAQAYAAGTLQSNPQQQVLMQNQGGPQVIVIQPANPQVVYVPTYDPTVVYVRPSAGAVVAGALLTFGVGIAIGALINHHPWGWGGWGWNWGRRTVIVNRNVWVVRNNRYRPPRYTYRPRPIVYNNRPGYGGNWSYRPPNYRPPSGGRPPSYRPPVSYQPSPNRPSNPPRPTQPSYRPPPNGNASRPPSPSRPPQGARPPQPPRNAYAGYQPSRGGGNPQPQTGGRTSVFNSDNRGSDARAASRRGQESMGRAKR
jgi:hypothetical protein